MNMEREAASSFIVVVAQGKHIFGKLLLLISDPRA